MIQRFLYAIDLFGVPVTLNFFGNEKSKSKFGGICSILISAFVIWAFINGSKDLYQRTNPKTISFQSYEDNPSPITISPDGFPIAFQIQAPDDLNFETYIDESIYTLNIFHSMLYKVQHDNGTIEEIWNDTKLLTEKCTPEHFGKEIGLTYSIIFADPITCIAPKQPALEKIQIQGVSDSVIFERILVELIPCNNNTSPIPCAPQEKMDKYLAGAWFNALYNNMVVNPNNYTHPYDSFQDYYYTMVGFSNYREVDINLGHVEVLTDSGWLYESVKSDRFVKVAQILESQANMRHPRGVLIAINFQVSKVISHYSRSYKKIQDILAEVAGLTNTALVLLFVLITPYLKLKFRESLLNELFDANILKKQSGRGFRSYAKRMLSFSKISKESSPTSSPRKGAVINQKNLLSVQSPLSFSNPPLSKGSPNIDFEDVQHKMQSNSFRLNNDNTHSQKNRKENLAEGKQKKKLNQKYLSMKSRELKAYACKDSALVTQENLLISNSPNSSPINQEKETRNQSKEKWERPNIKVLEEHENESPECPSFSSESSVNYQRHPDKKISFDLPEISFSTQRKRLKEDNHLKPIGIFPSNQEIEYTGVKVPNENTSLKRVNKVNLSLWEYICSFAYKSKSFNQKMKIINEGIKEVNTRLDVRYILSKIIEIEKFRALLLDHDQLILFNHLPKPQIEAEDPDHKPIQRSFSDIILKKITARAKKTPEEEIIEACRRIKNKKKKTNIDKKLLEVFGEIKK